MTFGSRRTAAGSPCAMMRPSASTRMRWHSAMTNSMLCSITTKVEPCSALIALSRSRRLASMVRLTPPAGSSSSARRGPAQEHRPGAGEFSAARRLVEQREAGTGHDRHRGVEQLLLAVAQPAGRLVGKMAEAEKAEHALRRRRQPGIARAEQAREHAALVLLASQDQVL